MCHMFRRSAIRSEGAGWRAKPAGAPEVGSPLAANPVGAHTNRSGARHNVNEITGHISDFCYRTSTHDHSVCAFMNEVVSFQGGHGSPYWYPNGPVRNY